MSIAFDPFHLDLSHAQPSPPIVPTRDAVKGSVVTRALDVLNRPPSASRHRPPELATLDTPPSSCEPPTFPDDTSLLKPPTVPSQQPQDSSSPMPMPLGDVPDPCAVQGENLPFKMKNSPTMGFSLDSTACPASGSFDMVNSGTNFGEMTFDNSIVPPYLLNPSLFQDDQTSSLSSDHLTYAPLLDSRIDAGYDGDLSHNDTSFDEFVCKQESPEYEGGLDSSAAVQADCPSEEPSLCTSSSASEYSMPTADWTRIFDTPDGDDVATIQSRRDSDRDRCRPYELLSFTPPPLLLPSPQLPVLPAFTHGQDLDQLAAVSNALERPSAVSSAFVADKVSLYHAPQPSTVPAVFSVPSQPAFVPIDPAPVPAPSSMLATAMPADPPQQVAPVKPATRGRPRKVTVEKATTKIRISQKKQVQHPEHSVIVTVPALTPRAASPNSSDSDSTVVPGSSHAHSSSGHCCDHQELPTPPLHHRQLHDQQQQQQQQPVVPSQPSGSAVGAALTVRIPPKPVRKAAARRAPRKTTAAKSGTSKPAPKRKRASRPRPKPVGPAIRYPCRFPGCTKTFSSPHNLQEHGQVHDPSREREFKCPMENCRLEKREYFFRRDQRRHNRKQHLDVPGLVDWLEEWADREAEKRAAEKERVRMEKEAKRLAEMSLA